MDTEQSKELLNLNQPRQLENGYRTSFQRTKIITEKNTYGDKFQCIRIFMHKVFKR
jgi:hypothetical protein